MGYELGIFSDSADGGLDADFVQWLVEERWPAARRHYCRLWEYYANPMYDVSGAGAAAAKLNESGRCYIQAQERGLPPRITGLVYSGSGVASCRGVSDIQRKEVVVENDIAWRVNAAVDFLFGKGVSFVSRSPDGRKAAEIEAILKALFSANGGVGFFQDMAVLGSVYGFVDCLVRCGEAVLEQFQARQRVSFERALELAGAIDIELVEATRALPVLDEQDYRKINYYIQHFQQYRNKVAGRGGFLQRLVWNVSGRGGDGVDRRQQVAVTEIISARAWQRYENERLVAQGEVPWGFVPVVHIQNIAQPNYYEGASDVEPLIPLQDELNTRLSDRANRITFQAFKMYLGKGIEGFENRPVSPGRMWYTDNPDATIEEFGGDAAVPSEDVHISEIREAMDKVSGVTPVVAGVLKNKLGNLTSAVALKMTLMGMLSKTERKRLTYGEGLKRLCRMVLAILDSAGIYETDEADRAVDVVFPSPLPENMLEKLREAQLKKELGVPAGQVLRELGYEVDERD